MNKRVVVALGGNAILSGDASAAAQQQAIRSISGQLAALIADGNELIISHGNGPQVGNLLLQQQAADSSKNPALPLDSLVAMTQGSIGWWIQKAMAEALAARGIAKDVVTVVTQVIVDRADDAFQNPTKPIGPFFSEEEAKRIMERDNVVYKEDSGRGWRRVVPSPRPVSIAEYRVVKKLMEAGVVAIVAGGGGIPVARDGDRLVGIEAVIDKDLAAQKLAELVEADTLIFLTGVDNVYLHFNTPQQQKIEQATTSQMREYISQGLFAAGSMLPKIEAAVEFAQSGAGRSTIITSLERVSEISQGAGTTIHQ